ncbi:MAG: shikimate kinase [Candidatus Brockarchaeota archaeon]|nr:shikimate kinase [Candidatus Brockarchaeota archaeon]
MSRAIVHGAVSIVNAMANGLGAALGVGLRVEASCRLMEEPVFRIRSGEIFLKAGSLPEKVCRLILGDFGVQKGCEVSIYSEIPARKGLKSSSAVSSAVALACLKEVTGEAGLMEAAKYSVEASIETGVSVTGAFDDASACLLGGIVVTDNFERKVLARRLVDSSLRVVILIPSGGMLSGMVDTSLFKPVEPLMRLAHRLALNGEEWLAMTLNGLAVSTALGLGVEPALEALKNGAIASGVSGKGPAVAAVVRPQDVEKVRRALSGFGRVVETGVCNENANVE